MGYVSHTMKEIRRYPSQTVVGKLARREYVHHVRRLLGARSGNVDDSGSLLALQVGNEAVAEIIRLL